MLAFTAFERRMVSTAFYSNEIETKLRKRNLCFEFSSKKVNCNEVKIEIDLLRQQELYSHECGKEGERRGCPFLDIMDGVWKIGFRHCAMRMVVSIVRESCSQALQ